MLETERKVRSAMAIVFGIKSVEIPANAKLNHFEGWDSLNHMNLLLALEDEFVIEFTDEEIVSLDSLSVLIDSIIEKKL